MTRWLISCVAISIHLWLLNSFSRRYPRRWSKYLYDPDIRTDEFVRSKNDSNWYLNQEITLLSSTNRSRKSTPNSPNLTPYVLLAHEIRTHRILDRQPPERRIIELVLSTQLSRSQLYARSYETMRSGIFLSFVVCDSWYHGNCWGCINGSSWWDTVRRRGQALWSKIYSREADMDVCGCGIRLEVLGYSLDHGDQIDPRTRNYEVAPEGKSTLDHTSDGWRDWGDHADYRE